MIANLIRASVAATLAAASLSAQSSAPNTGAFITRLGTDTIAVERFVVSNGRLEGDVVRRTPRVTVTHYVADIDPAGRVRKMSVTMRAPADSGPPRYAMTEEFADTSVSVRVTRRGVADTAGTGVRYYSGIGVPSIMMEPASYGIYEQALRSARLGPDSVGYAYVGNSRGAQPLLWLSRHGSDSVAFNNTIFPGWVEMARVDSRGRILGVNAGRTTVKTTAERVANVDIAGVAAEWAGYEAAHGPLTTSPLDTARATIGGSDVQVVYSRPSRRGRKIFGTDVVPFGEVWRTGANAATELTTTGDLVLGSTVIPAGKYTLFTVPEAAGATLIVSKDTGEWGTDYNPSKDLLRIPMTMRALSSPAERFTIGLSPQGGSGALVISWDDREYSVPFTAR